MNPWTILQLASAAIAIISKIFGERVSLLILTAVGIAILGVTAILVGLEGIIKRRIVLGSRYHRAGVETYLGLAATAQGMLFLFLGAFFVAVAVVAYLNSGRSLFLYFIRNPGLPLLIIGASCFLGATVAMLGSVEQKQGAKWVILLDLLTSRLLPGLILVIIGLAATLLGLFEIVAPQAFDQLGGGFLEVLFGAR